jgi:uncharacterized protein YjaG (DUF416 family)
MEKLYAPTHLPTKFLDDDKVALMRSAMEHRTVWYYLLVDEMLKAGLDIEVARNAIARCGCFHAHTKYPEGDDLRAFASALMNDVTKKTLEADVEVSDTELNIEFHYCPHVTAWQTLTQDKEKIEKLCDIAMEGDRAIVAEHPSWRFSLTDTIGKGCPTCKLRIVKTL